jgi:hypothetical protein
MSAGLADALALEINPAAEDVDEGDVLPVAELVPRVLDRLY